MAINLHQLIRLEHSSLLPAWLKEFQDSSSGEADIRFEAVAKIGHESRLMAAGVYGYCAEGLLAYTKEGKKLLIPIEKLGQPFSIIVEDGAKSLPAIESVLHLCAFTKGAIPLHASAFQQDGEGVLVAAFPHGGKTSLLLAALAEGANFISDDWLYLKNGAILGLPIPLSIRSWQVQQLPKIKTQAEQRLMRLAAWLSRSVPKLSAWFDKRAGLRVSAKKLFPQATMSKAKASIFCLSIVYESEDVCIEAVSQERFLALLMEIQMQEWDSILRLYRLYRAEYPEKANAVLDDFEGNLRAALQESLKGLRLYCVYQPHPVSLKTVYAAFQESILRKDK
jgi:hypothetical protein